MTTTLLVRQDQLATTRLVSAPDTPLVDGQVRVRVDAFALTANNVTYAALGDMLNYWGFFPSGEEGWGIVPVWGFGTVVESAHPDVAVGERLYGYWPMASSAVLSPERANAAGFSDGAPHRAGLHTVYNHYLRSSADPFYRDDNEDLQALLRPLFVTSWLIDDFLADQQFFGARRLLLSSASSKTAWGTAFQLAQRGGLEVVGLTSPGNVAFCESLGCYDRVLAYDALEQLGGAQASVYIDFAGSVALRKRIHAHFTGESVTKQNNYIKAISDYAKANNISIPYVIINNTIVRKDAVPIINNANGEVLDFYKWGSPPSPDKIKIPAGPRSYLEVPQNLWQQVLTAVSGSIISAISVISLLFGR